jgi:hypothetical protein
MRFWRMRMQSLFSPPTRELGTGYARSVRYTLHVGDDPIPRSAFNNLIADQGRHVHA